ncbi:hypothetical protein AVEN_35030-1 [Araneus ventricosus]|uniref:Uncharacterized protein n=1 Tax=Araneus ventricosus TaxID=182803 RepID=A0A4Y2I0K0_ARAVE|nr:hypothetical protein AVEN_35030-1 [Araneus ventricosus]
MGTPNSHVGVLTLFVVNALNLVAKQMIVLLTLSNVEIVLVPNAASSKSCPTWIFEKEVIAVKIERNITFPEARQIVKDRTPRVGVSYSSTVQMQPKISNNTSEINSLQLPVSIPLSTLPSKFFTAPTATTSMKNNSPKKKK